MGAEAHAVGQATLLAAAGLVVFAAAHVALWRIFPRAQGLRSLVASGALAACTALGACIAAGAPVPALIAFLPTFAACMLAYLHWYVGTWRSLSVRALEEIAAAGGSLTEAELDERYPKKGMLSTRVATLAENGWIVAREGGLFPSARARLSASAIDRVRSFYGISHAG